MHEETPLPTPGPEPGLIYTMRKPVPPADALLSTKGTAVTVSVTNPKPTPLTTIISFIVGHRQAAPWLDHLALNLPLKTPATLHTPDNPPISLSILSMTPPMPPPDARALRESANDIFRSSKDDFRGYQRAALLYICSLSATSHIPDRAPLHANLALCRLRTCAWAGALHRVTAAQRIVGLDARGRYRRALARTEMQAGVAAVRDLREASKMLGGRDAVVERELIRLEGEVGGVIKKNRRLFAEVYNVMLQSKLFETCGIVEE